MDCPTARERLLDAEPAVLRAEGDDALAAHLRACARCAAMAARILDRTAALSAALQPRPHAAVDDVIARARAAAAASPADAGAPERIRGRTPRDVASAVRRRHPAPIRVLLPLAAAAGLAAVLLLDRGAPPADVDAGPPPPLPAALARPARVAAVNAAAGAPVALFRTADPKITVVWYPRQGSVQ